MTLTNITYYDDGAVYIHVLSISITLNTYICEWNLQKEVKNYKLIQIILSYSFYATITRRKHGHITEASFDNSLLTVCSILDEV